MPVVSPNVRIRVREHFEIGEHSIVDDYCYSSTRVRIGDWSHIATGCSVSAGVPIAPLKARNRESVLRQVEQFLRRQGD